MGDSLSAVLLANSQPLGQRLGSLDRPPALQKTSLGVLSSHASKALLDNGGGGSISSGPSGNAHYVDALKHVVYLFLICMLFDVNQSWRLFIAQWSHSTLLQMGTLRRCLTLTSRTCLP